MRKERYMNFMTVAIVAIVLQSYFQETENFSSMLGKSIVFFVPLIWAMFLSLLLYPVQEFLQKKASRQT